MKFLRHLAAATLLVAVIVLIGLAWNHFAPSTLIGNTLSGPGFARVGPGVHLKGGPPGPGNRTVINVRPGQPARVRVRGGGFKIIRNAWPGPAVFSPLFEAVNLKFLRHTAVIEAEIIAAVVLLNIGYRRWLRPKRY